MLSLFPELLNYQIFAPLILRIVLGGVFIYTGYYSLKITKQQPVVGVLYIILGILLVIGLFVQGVALVISLVLIIKLLLKIRRKEFLTDGVNYYLLLLAISLSLLLLGAGYPNLSLDIPV